MSVTQAKRVLTYRTRFDGFSSVDELERVPGFPQEFIAQLKDRAKP
jgi:DNA uptake protein ComE-like DNA-binding protein